MRKTYKPTLESLQAQVYELQDIVNSLEDQLVKDEALLQSHDRNISDLMPPSAPGTRSFGKPAWGRVNVPISVGKDGFGNVKEVYKQSFFFRYWVSPLPEDGKVAPLPK